MWACRVMKRFGGVNGVGGRSEMGLWVTPVGMCREVNTQGQSEFLPLPCSVVVVVVYELVFFLARMVKYPRKLLKDCCT